MQTRTVKYTSSDRGRDPRNPLLDLHPDDSAWYFEQLISWLDTASAVGQEKDQFVWEQLIKRRPKQLHKGARGPNSVLTTVSGLLSNYWHNTKKYGVCRISRKQMEDIEFVSQIMATINSSHTIVVFQQALFDQGGTSF